MDTNTTGVEDAKRHGIPLPVPTAGAKKPARTRGRKERGPKNQLLKYTIEEAFSYFNGPAGYAPENADGKVLNVKRAILSAAFLLDWLSTHGNEPVDGFSAHGLAEILNRAARDLDYSNDLRRMEAGRG